MGLEPWALAGGCAPECSVPVCGSRFTFPSPPGDSTPSSLTLSRLGECATNPNTLLLSSRAFLCLPHCRTSREGTFCGAWKCSAPGECCLAAGAAAEALTHWDCSSALCLLCFPSCSAGSGWVEKRSWWGYQSTPCSSVRAPGRG